MSHLLIRGARRSVVREENARNVNGCWGANCNASKYWSTVKRFLSERNRRSALEKASGAPELNVATQLNCQLATILFTTGLEEAMNFRPGSNGSSSRTCRARGC